MTIQDKIKKEIDSETLIGCYHKTADKPGYFSDIRGNEGEISKDYEFAPIEYIGDLIDGEFYEFTWSVNNEESPLAVSIVGAPTIVNKPQFLKRLYDAKANLRGSNREFFINSQDNLFKEVTGADHTYIYELLQNANDYPSESDDNVVKVKFVVTKHYLLFLHTGREFNLKNVAAICTVNQGEKRSNTKTIGYKGIGFKTVFVNNNYVYLRSGEWRLRFDEQYVYEHDSKRPWVFMPIATSDSELDEELTKALADIPNCYRVVFAMRNKRGDASENLPQFDKVFSDSQILLFIPNVYKVEVYAGEEQRYLVTKDKEKWLVDSCEWPVTKELREIVEEDVEKGGKIPEKFRDIENINISFATGRDGNKIVPVEDARVYNYLPTELRLNFGFLINADFVPNGARNGLHDTQWNTEVMTQCGRQFVTWLTSLLVNEGEWDANSVFSLIPEFRSSDFYAKQFKIGFREALAEAAFVPTKKDGLYKLVKASDIIWDDFGLTYGEEPMFTDSQFYTFTGESQLLPIRELRNNAVLRSLLKDLFSGKATIYGSGSQLGLLPLNREFQSWLSDKMNNIGFNSFLLREKWMDDLKSRNILLSSNGTLECFEKLYLNVDDYVQELPMLDGTLLRIDKEVRDELSKIAEWYKYKSSFKELKPIRFAEEVKRTCDANPQFLAEEANSIGYIRVMAGLGVKARDYLSSDFPFFTTDGETVTWSEDVYIPSSFGKRFVSHPWVNQEWAMFISEKYFEKNSDKILAFLSSANITELDAYIIYRKILSNEKRSSQIAEYIREKRLSVDFYRFLALELKMYATSNKFTPAMKAKYSVVTTDGSNDLLTPLSTTIFFQSEDWEDAIHFSWMPSSICLGLSDCYFENLNEDDKSLVRSFFGHDNLISPLTSGTLKTLICTQKNLETICNNITTVEASKAFLKYLLDNQQTIFKDEKPSSAFRAIPILVDGVDELCPLASMTGRCYYHNEELDRLLSQSWMEGIAIQVCSSEYNDLFASNQNKNFMKELGLYTFELVGYVQSHILAVPGKIRGLIETKEANLEFHRFFFSISQKLNDDNFKSLRDFPIYISSPENDESEMVENSDDHYLPSAFLTEIIKKDIVPIDILDCIHPDYISSSEERAYYLKKLENCEIDADNLVDYIIQDGNKEAIVEYITDPERNIRFWRWFCDSNFKQDVIKKFKVFPMLGHELNSIDDVICKPEDLFISNAYTDSSNIESFYSEFADNPHFVSDSYKEENDERDWPKLFKSLNVTADTSNLIFKYILPNLRQYQREDIVELLSEQEFALSKRLKDPNDATIREQFADLQLKCQDGNYRKPAEAILSGRYFGIDKMPFADIELGNLISEEYITREGITSDKASKISRLLVNVFDACGITLHTPTQIRDTKLSYFLGYQESYMDDKHLNIIRELAKEYGKDVVGIRELIQNGKPLRLWAKDGKSYKCDELYFGSAYNPECDFEANGITYRPFVSDDYVNDLDSKPLVVKFFKDLRVSDRFRERDLSLLNNERFSRYFWSDYAKDREFELASICTSENLKSVACIPTAVGNKMPMEVYDYRNKRLQYTVMAIPGGASKLPNVELPAWVEEIGLRPRLFLSDCLSYLKTNNPNYRRLVFDWIVKAPEETLRAKRHEIDKFIEDADWFNGQKKFVPLKGLVALQWNNKMLSDNFSSNPYVCNPSYMPEYQEDYNKLCSIFKIKVLINDDFEKAKSGKFSKDDTAKTEIAKRLLYISYKSEREDWQDLYKRRKDKLDACDICSCEQIDYKYDENIKTDLMSYVEDNEHLWYVDKWNGSMFIDVLEWVKRVFEVKDFDDAFLRKMFLTPFSKFLQQQEYDYSSEFYALLSQEDKAGLKIAEEDDIEDFVEDYEDKASLDDSLNHESDAADQHIEAQQPVDATDSAGKHSDVEEWEDEQKHDEDESATMLTSTSSNRKTRSDKGGHHQSRQQSEISSTYDDYAQPASTSSQNQKEKPSIKSKLEEKWKHEAEKPVSRPTSHYSGNETYQPLVEPSQPVTHSESGVFGNEEYDGKKSKASFAKSRSALKARNTEAQRQAEEVGEELEINELLDQTEKYTFLWFKYLMELLYKDNATSHVRSQQVDFCQKEYAAEKKILRLSSPTSVVQSWVEGAGNSEIFAFDNRSGVKVKGTIVKVDSVSIDVMLDDGIDDKDYALYSLAKFFRLKAESDTNFITSLKRRFLQLNYPDDYNLRDYLPDAIRFIYGPPGTGKTTRLVTEISEILKGADHKTNILVLTPTNKAADVIAKRLSEDEDCYNCLSRYGTTNDPSLIEEEAIMMTRDTMDMDMFDNNIVVTTVARYAYDTVKPDDTVICDYPWDYIVIDEASMIDIVNIAYILHKGRPSQFIIAGDPKQIQPIKRNQNSLENIYQMVGIDDLKSAINDYKRYPIVPLLTQYRSVPIIGNLVSRFAYNSMVKSFSNRRPQKPLRLDGIPVKTLNFVGFEIQEFDSLTGVGAINDSAFHLYAAIFTYNMARYMAEQIAKKYPNTVYSIGIVCPYGAEAKAIGQLIECRPIDQRNCKVSCGTVHSFQGDECDIMFVVMNPPVKITSDTHINNENIINVAMSRARDYLFIVTPSNSAYHLPVINQIGRITQAADRQMLYSWQLEKTIFGEDDYIRNHTSVTCHLPVNVYYDSVAEYEVRIDDHALDIQLNDTE